MKTTSLLTALLLIALSAPVATAQDGEGRQRRQFDPQQMRERMEQFRQQRAERMREDLGFEKDEWEQVVNPLVQEVEGKRREVTIYASSGFGRGGMGGFIMRGNRGGRDNRGDRSDRDNRSDRSGRDNDSTRPASEARQHVTVLREALEDENTDADAIKTALKQLRSGRADAQKKLAQSRKKLRELLTARQEAQMVLMGVLD